MSISPDIESAVASINRHGFWFIDIPRTGSSSIRAELGRLYGPPYVKGNIADPEFYGKTGAIVDHLPAVDMIALMGPEAWARLFTFSFVRNPWDRVHSIYQYRRKIERDLPPDMPYTAYVRELARQKALPPQKREWYEGFVRSSCDYLTDAKGTLLVNAVVLYEEREEGIRRINERLQKPLTGDLRLMGTNHAATPYHTFYDDETRGIIADLYADDIRAFGYSFEEKAAAAAVAPARAIEKAGEKQAAKTPVEDGDIPTLAYEHHRQKWRALSKKGLARWFMPEAVIHKVAYKVFKGKIRRGDDIPFFVRHPHVDFGETESILASFYARQLQALREKGSAMLVPYAWLLASLLRHMGSRR